MLARLDVPYVAAQPLEFQTLEQWQAVTPRGLSPVEATIMVAIPELDGATGSDGVRRARRLGASAPARRRDA